MRLQLNLATFGQTGGNRAHTAVDERHRLFAATSPLLLWRGRNATYILLPHVVPSGPEIHAVVEVAFQDDVSWARLPPRPWPSFVRLSRFTSAPNVALLIGVVSTYGRAGSGPAASVKAVLGDFPHVLPGGVAVLAPGRQILPSCCCGLETWNEWEKILATGQSPWTGHDPAPLVEVLSDRVQVWSDGGMGNKPADEVPILFSRADFHSAITGLRKDLEGFLEPLGGWLRIHAPDEAHEFIQNFTTTFIE